jgi:hypothetical protein
MSGSDDGTKPFATVRLPKDTARMIDHLVAAAVSWGKASAFNAESESERADYTVLCYARKWLAEHIELLCEEAGVEPADTDQLIRFL